MKKINFKKINYLILEALKDELPPYFIERIKALFPRDYEEFLNKEVEKTDKIPEGKWPMNDTDKKNIIRIYFGIDVDHIKNLILTFYRSTDINFWKAYKKSLVDPNTKITFKDPWVDDIEKLYKNFLYKISVSETRSTEVVSKDATGKPIVKRGVIQKKKKKAGELVLSKNVVNFSTWIESYNQAYPNKPVQNVYNDTEFTKVNSQIQGKNMDVKLFNERNMYVYITKDPSAALRKSVSIFYDSCRNIFKSGVKDIMYDVLDYNCKVGFIIFDNPFVDRNGNEHPYIPFARSIIRVTNKGIAFDRVYNQYLSRFEVPVAKIISKYSGIKPINLSDDQLHGADATYEYDYLKNVGSPYVEKFSRKVSLRSKKSQMEYAKDNPENFLTNYVGVETSYEIFDEAINLAINNLDVDSSSVRYNRIFEKLNNAKKLDKNTLKKFLAKSKDRFKLLEVYTEQTGIWPDFDFVINAIQTMGPDYNFDNAIHSDIFKHYGQKALNVLLKKYPKVIRYIQEPTKAQTDYALKKDPSLVMAIRNPTTEQILDAINRDKKLAIFIFSHFTHLKENTALINDLLSREGWLIQYIEKPTAQQMSIALNNDPSLLMVVNTPIALKRQMIDANPMNIKYIKNAPPDLQMRAVKLNKDAYKFITNPDQSVTDYYNR